MTISRHFVAILLPALFAAGASASPPNILLLVAEDLSPRLGAYGDTVAHTPTLDALARRGVRYTRAFTTAGVCAPSRAALITGQHQISFGAQHMRTSTGPLGEYYATPPRGLRAFPELLRAAGYFTFTDRKLDYQFSGIVAGTGPFTIWNRENAPDTAWRERAPNQPFFGMINFMETHESGVMRPSGPAHSDAHRQTQAFRAPMAARISHRTDPAAVPLPPYFPDTATVRADVARHYDNIALMDKRVGAILAALAEDGLDDDTIVVWTTDHGDGLPRSKRELYDSGLRVPMIVHWPPGLPGGARFPAGSTEERLVSFVDIAPTLLAWAGVTAPVYLHGRRFDAGEPRKYVYAARDRIDEVMDRQRAVRDTRYKYIRSWHPAVPGGHPLAYRDNIDMVREWRARHDAGDLSPVQARWFQGAGREQLYDLQNDPHETHNLAGDPEFAATAARLTQALEAFLQRVGDTGEVPEGELRARLLQNGAIAKTPLPHIQRVGEQLVLTSAVDASIAYRPADSNAGWRLYAAPIPLADIEAKAVRYGWRESAIARFAPTP